ncbi:CLUMA_CG016730, isoform A [Clunio marinus]|uniref:CLUMA_CG016730, isoform A n=1 Tax=Clunio marinus TaxID=568069 RepID=A0A1J1IXH7_9DIPT|nr:CLUMA_CG016730, isoform A [Clunio marinus]
MTGEIIALQNVFIHNNKEKRKKKNSMNKKEKWVFVDITKVCHVKQCLYDGKHEIERRLFTSQCQC